MQHIQSEIEIAATADRIWRVLTDFSAYSSWNPFVRSISGTQAPGSRLDVTIHPDGSKPMTETSPGRVRFRQGETFTGVLVPLLMSGSMLASTARGFAAMNQALKARAEA